MNNTTNLPEKENASTAQDEINNYEELFKFSQEKLAEARKHPNFPKDFDQRKLRINYSDELGGHIPYQRPRDMDAIRAKLKAAGIL